MYIIEKDGDAWFARSSSFVNLQESLSGFGSTATKALESLLHQEFQEEMFKTMQIRRWKCTNCEVNFYKLCNEGAPPCNRCSAGNQYTRLFK